MGGGLVQLVAKSSQDVYLTGNPQITFFNVVYKKHTNFCVEQITQVLSGNINNKLTCKFNRDGDLLYKVYLNYTNNIETPIPNNFGTYMIDNSEIFIGNQKIDSHKGHFMEIISRLNTEYTDSYKITTRLINEPYSKYQQLSCSCGLYNSDVNNELQKIILGKISVPFNFWFCRNPGLALPLIALQYNEVIMNIEFNQDDAVLNALKNGKLEVVGDFIYLDTDERRRFAQVSHEYLIEQVQINEHTLIPGTNDILLNFNNPVKELIFAPDWIDGYIPGIGNNNTLLTLNVNSQDLFESDKDLFYFTRKEIYEKYNSNPLSLIHADNYEGSIKDSYGRYDNIGVYSFSLNPRDYQPTGSLNFSAIQTCKLTIKNISPPVDDIGDVINQQSLNENRELKIYAINYNILKIVSGMGALAYVS